MVMSKLALRKVAGMYYTVPQMTALLEMPERSAYRAIERGEIAAVRPNGWRWLVQKSEVDRLLTELAQAK